MIFGMVFEKKGGGVGRACQEGLEKRGFGS